MTITASPAVRPFAVPFAVTPRRAGAATADLTALTIAHRALRSGTRLLANAVTEIANGAACSPERHEAIAWFAGHVLHEVAEHHRKEDDILWPVVVMSVGPEVDLDGLSDEYGVLHAVLHRAKDALSAFVAQREFGTATLAAALTELADDIDEHIAEEEARIFPVIREYVSKRDFERVEARFAKHNPYSHLQFVLPWFASVSDGAPFPARVPMRARIGRQRRQARWEQRRDRVLQ